MVSGEHGTATPCPLPRPEGSPAFNECLGQPTEGIGAGSQPPTRSALRSFTSAQPLNRRRGTSKLEEAGDFRGSEVSHSSGTIRFRSQGYLLIFCRPWAGQHLS